jgi:hypothetical protein
MHIYIPSKEEEASIAEIMQRNHYYQIGMASPTDGRNYRQERCGSLDLHFFQAARLVYRLRSNARAGAGKNDIAFITNPE